MTAWASRTVVFSQRRELVFPKASRLRLTTSGLDGRMTAAKQRVLGLMPSAAQRLLPLARVSLCGASHPLQQHLSAPASRLSPSSSTASTTTTSSNVQTMLIQQQQQQQQQQQHNGLVGSFVQGAGLARCQFKTGVRFASSAAQRKTTEADKKSEQKVFH